MKSKGRTVSRKDTASTSNPDKPEISVIVIAYNKERFVSRCLDSLLNQTLQPTEIIVCDDASTDGTRSILDDYVSRYPDIIKLVRHPVNVGIPANLNSGFQVANGEYLSLIAADDKWLPEKLEKEYLRLSETGAAWVYSRVTLYWGDLDEPTRTQEFWGTVPGYEGDVFEKVLRREMSLRNYLLRRDVAESLGYFDECVGMYEDWDFNLRMSKRYPIAHVPVSNVIYLLNDDGEHHAPMYRHMSEVNKILRKNKALIPEGMGDVARETITRFWPEQLMATEKDKAAYKTTLASLDLPYTPARIKPDGEGLVFLVSLPRSGSTMLQRVLGSHPDIHTTAEPWVMLHPLYALKREGINAEYDARVGRMALDDFLQSFPDGENAYYDGVRQLASTLYKRAVRDSGKSRFLDKTPRYFYILPELVRTFPKAKIVLLLRNPLAILASVLDTWCHKSIVEYESSDHCKSMLEGPRMLADAIEELGDNIFVTRYEDVVGNTEAEVSRICDYLELPYFPEMLVYGNSPVLKGACGDPKNVNKHSAPVSSYIETWKDTLDSHDLSRYALDYIERVGDEVLGRIGYPKQDLVNSLLMDAGGKNNSDMRVASFDAKSLNEKGENEYSAGNTERAEACFTQAYQLDPANVEICNNLVVLYWQKGDVEKSLTYLAEGLQIDSSDRNLIVNGGQILASLSQLEEARQLYSGYLRVYPDDAEVIELLSAISSDREASESNEGCSKGKSRELVTEDEAAYVQGDTSGAARPAAGDQVDKVATESSADQPGRFLSVPPEVSAEGVGELNVDFVDYLEPGTEKYAPKISIVIPSYNQGKYLEETILSVLDQNYPNLELIVMDGGSTDQSVEIIKKYEDKISYWTSAKDKGQYWAIDQGFRRSTGEIMAWINSDDKFHPGSFFTVASIFSQLNEVDWVTGTPNIMNADGEIKWYCSPVPVYSREYYLNKKYDFPNYIQQEGTFWRRPLWERVGSRLKTGLEMAGDLELWMRFFRYSKLYSTNVLLGCFRQYGDQKTSTGLDLYRAEANKELDKELKRFLKRGEARPEKAPIIVVHETVSEGARQSAPSKDPDYLLTAIVSTYNSEKFIRGCLEDLEAQTLSDRLEIIVVDSGSQQNEAVVVKDFQKRYPNIRYIRTEDRETIYSAWNRAAQVAQGKYLTNANTDDRHRPDAFARMVQVLEGDDSVALVYADAAVTERENAHFGDTVVTACFKWPEFDAKHLFSVCYIGPQPMWRRSLHERYGYFEASYRVAGDYDFWLRLVPYEKFVHIPEVLGLYLNSGNSIEHAFAGVGAKESEHAREKNWPREWGQRPALSQGYLVPADQYGNTTVSTEMQCPLVSIIMPTKDRLDMLERAVDSILAQTYSNWELVVVNDGGESISQLIGRKNSSGRIHCIENKISHGQAKARNMALDAAKGDIICYLDDDDLYMPHHLDVVVKALSVDGRDFIYTDAVIIKELGSGKEMARSNPYKHQRYSRQRLLVTNYIPINTWAHKRHCNKEVGVFDDTLSCYEDWEFLLRLSEKYDFHHVEGITVEVRHRMDKVDNVSRKHMSEMADVYREIYRKYSCNLPKSLIRERELTLKSIQGADEEHVQAEILDVSSDLTIATYGEIQGEALEQARDRFIQRANNTEYTLPSIHLFMIVGKGHAGEVADTLDSLARQIYTGWGLTIISNEPAPGSELDQLSMIEWLQVEEPLMALKGAIESSEGEWISVLNVGDTLSPLALSNIVDYVNLHPEWRFIYADEDVLDDDGGQAESYYKPDFNLELLRSYPYIGNFCLFRKDVLNETGDSICKTSLIHYDVCLKVFEYSGESAIGHIASVLNHRAAASDDESLQDEFRMILESHLERAGIDARIMKGTAGGTLMVDYRLKGQPRVTVVIFAGNNTDKLGHTVSALLQKTDYENFEVRIAASAACQSQLSSIVNELVQIEYVDASLRRADYVERVARECNSDYLLLMDPGSIPIQPNWMERMLSLGQREDTGVVGVRLISPDQNVVHAGIVTGVGVFGVGARVFDGDRLDDAGYMKRAHVCQNMSAVTSACMLVKKDLYLQVDGFDDALDVQMYQDVDFCQRIIQEGRKIVWTPFVSLLYTGQGLDSYQGKEGFTRVQADAERVLDRWLGDLARDAAYNRNLGMRSLDFEPNRSFIPVWDPEIIEEPRIVGFGAGSYGSWKYRVAEPLNALHNRGIAQCLSVPFSKQSQMFMPTPVELERIQAGTLLMHNTVHDYCIEALEKFKKYNQAFIVFGQDDLMSALPPKNPFSRTIYKDIKKRIRKSLSLADRLVVSTEPLAHALNGMVDDIVVVPNCINEAVWGTLQSQRNISRKPRVGWAGAQQHLGDLQLLEAVVRETASEVDWVFFGMCPDFLKPFVKEIHDPVPFEEYPKKLASLNLDLAVAPLERNKFNESKSNLRLLEYGMLGWPVIASDIYPYQEGPVCRVPNQAKAWIKAVRERINDMDTTRHEGDVLHQWVHENWMLKDRMDDWLAALDPVSMAGQHKQIAYTAAGKG